MNCSQTWYSLCRSIQTTKCYLSLHLDALERIGITLLEVKLPYEPVWPATVGRSVCHNFIKGRDVTLAWSYRFLLRFWGWEQRQGLQEHQDLPADPAKQYYGPVALSVSGRHSHRLHISDDLKSQTDEKINFDGWIYVYPYWRHATSTV